MRHSRRWGRARVVLLITFSALLALAAPGASAHIVKDAGPLSIALGWGNEPPLTGLANFVEVGVSTRAGAPLPIAAGKLSVEVTYGSAALTLPLIPSEEPGELRADLIPTRSGTYAFHVSGTVRGQTLDVSATCSEGGLECVEESAGIEFPVQDPSRGELAERLGREADRVGEADDSADSAKRIAVIALALAAVATVAALGPAIRRRRKNGRP